MTEDERDEIRAKFIEVQRLIHAEQWEKAQELARESQRRMEQIILSDASETIH